MARFLTIACLIMQVSLFSQEDLIPKFDFKKNTLQYSVEYNDTLARIALNSKVSVAFLLYLNEDIKNPDLIFPGQKVRVPNEDAVKFIISQSRAFLPYINKMGAMKYKDRKKAINEMVNKDWLAIPVLLQALDHKDVEIRENARLALREIHRKKVKVQSFEYIEIEGK